MENALSTVDLAQRPSLENLLSETDEPSSPLAPHKSLEDILGKFPHPRRTED